MPRVHVSGFAALPYALLDQLGDHKNIGWLYLWLYRHGHGSEQGAWASIATLARECHMKKDAVAHGLRWLVDHGWAVRVTRPGRSSVYHLRLDTPQPSHPPNGGQHPSPSQGTSPGRHPSPEPGVPPTPRMGDITRPPNGGYKQEPRNQNPGTRAQDSSSSSLVPCSLSTRAREIRSEQPHRSAALPPAPAPLQRPPTPAHLVGVDPRNPGHLDPADPYIRFLLASPLHELSVDEMYLLDTLDRQQLGPAPSRGPLDPPAEAPRLPVPVSALPAELQPIADRIEAYWLARNGQRSTAAFRALVEELELVLPKAGRSGVLELLRQAIQAGWPAINARSWLIQRGREPDLSSHPAYQTFTAA